MSDRDATAPEDPGDEPVARIPEGPRDELLHIGAALPEEADIAEVPAISEEPAVTEEAGDDDRTDDDPGAGEEQ